jgi:hypothetical protein
MNPVHAVLVNHFAIEPNLYRATDLHTYNGI